MKLGQFTQALPSDVHRWIIGHKPGDLTIARIADDYVVLSKPLQAQTSNYSANSDNNAGEGKSSRNLNSGTGKKSSIKRHSSKINCLTAENVGTRCNRVMR